MSGLREGWKPYGWIMSGTILMDYMKGCGYGSVETTIVRKAGWLFHVIVKHATGALGKGTLDDRRTADMEGSHTRGAGTVYVGLGKIETARGTC
jgi:hypothetical protein